MLKIVWLALLIVTISYSNCGNKIPGERMANGKKVYETYCQSCHMVDGGGVPGLNAPLKQSKYVAGDKKKLIDIVLHGSAALANEPEREYGNIMPSHVALTDQQIADVLTYINNSFDNKGPVITPEEVKSARK